MGLSKYICRGCNKIYFRNAAPKSADKANFYTCIKCSKGIPRGLKSNQKQKILDVLSNNCDFKSSGCWEWTRGKDSMGYGTLRINGKDQRIHRISAMLFKNFNLESSLFVCHKCDNSSCFNPNHLFIGTQLDNMRDCYRKGRGKNVFYLNPPKGEKHPRAKFSNAQVLSIKRKLKQGEKSSHLAKKYQVSIRTIQAIKAGQNWNHL